jgi:hypothetical protein
VVGLPLERLRSELKAWAGTGEPWNSILAVIAEGSRRLNPGAGSQPSQLLP